MEKSESIANLAAALCAAQAEMPTAKKDAVNPFFKSKYADLASIMEAAMPVLTKHGLSVSQLVSNLDGQTALTTILMHSSGEYISSSMPLLLKDQNAQGQGSSITYARRYALMSAIGMVADEDDDGNAGSQPARTSFSRDTGAVPGVTTASALNSNDDEKITDKQIYALNKILGVKKSAWEAAKGVKVEELTKAQASKYISDAKEKEAPATTDEMAQAFPLEESA